MSDSKFTPGPWTINANADHPAAGGKYALYKVEPYVCEVFYTNEKGQANARLIAAAPDLLEALIEFLECEFAVTDKAAIANARAAIAKATA